MNCRRIGIDACMFAAAGATCAATGENMNATRFSFGCSAMSEAERPALPNAAKGGKAALSDF
jgi:hypothetical protein